MRTTLLSCAIRSACSLLCFIVLNVGGDGGELSAQGLCACPTGGSETTINDSLCIDGVWYPVSIIYCHVTYSPPSLTAPCTTTNGVNAFTTVRRVCATGTPLPTDDAKVLKALFCLFDPLGRDKLNQYGSIPYCDEEPNYYCWVVAMPRCLQRVGPCLGRCSFGEECCIQQWQLCKDRQLGMVIKNLFNNCNTSGTCDQACNEVECDYAPGSCPTCP
jgi:hypothetical protein